MKHKTFCYTHNEHDHCTGWVRGGFKSEEDYKNAPRINVL